MSAWLSLHPAGEETFAVYTTELGVKLTSEDLASLQRGDHRTAVVRGRAAQPLWYALEPKAVGEVRVAGLTQARALAVGVTRFQPICGDVSVTSNPVVIADRH